MAMKEFTTKYEASWSDADEMMLHLDTGSWRTVRPVVEVEKCTYCGLCALYCPPQCMEPMGDHFKANLDYCKGCGICAAECNQDAITMMAEE